MHPLRRQPIPENWEATQDGRVGLLPFLLVGGCPSAFRGLEFRA